MGERKRLSALQNSTACDVVNQRYDYLVGHVNAMRIFPYLVSSGLVDQEFRQYLDGERTDKDKMMALLQELIRSPTETWFDIFTNALSKVSQYEVIAGELLGDFSKLMAERLAHPRAPPDDVPKRRRPQLTSSSSEPMLVIKVANSISGVDGVMKKAMDDAQAGHVAALLELQKASGRVLEAEKGKVYAEAEKSALEEREQKSSKELTVANEMLIEAEMHQQLLVKESQSYKDKAEEIQRRMEMENMRLMEDLAQIRLQKETAMERAMEVEGERSVLEKKVASLQAEAERVRREREEEFTALEQQLSNARKQQLGEELQSSHKEELGHLKSQLERSVTKTVTLEGELAEVKRTNERLEQGMSRLKEELEAAMVDTESVKEGYRQAATKVDGVSAELAKTQAKLTSAHSVYSDLQDKYRHKENEFDQYKRMHVNCDVTNPPNKPQLLQRPSLNGPAAGRNQLDAELLAVEEQLVSDSELPSHRLARYEGHVWKQHRVRQASRVIKDKK